MKNLYIQKILVFLTIVIVGTNYANASMLLQDSLVFEIDDNNIKLLESAPSFTGMDNLDSGVQLALPDPSGTFVNYSFFKNNVLSESTANDYPGIYTLTGYSLIHKDHFVNIVVHDNKISGIILKNFSPAILIRFTETGNYLTFYGQGNQFECTTSQGNFRPPVSSGSRSASNGATLKNYTIAVVITDEYEAANGNGTAAIAAAVATVSQMSALYKRDMAIEFTAIIAAEDLAIFNVVPPGGSSASYGATVVSAYFNSANYDLGHVFHNPGGSGGSGQAGLGVVCNNSGSPINKARAWSQANPNNDYGFLSIVVHEVGHMFSATHTFNSNDGTFCNSARNDATSYEPGSGTTLMAYPGVCGSQNLTTPSGGTIFSSIPFFHVANLEQMVAYANGAGNSCATGTASGNSAPVANANPCNAGAPITIPANTPFELTGSATDANNDNLTYSWEQFDAGPPHGGAGAACGSTTGPIFRVYEPSASPTRSFPSLEYILNNANVAPANVGECLPTAARNLNFKLSVRDNNAGGGGIHCSQITLVVNATVGPLAVTAPNTAVTWAAGSSQTITWSGSNTSSICGTVNIRLSIDGGNSYPFTLASATSNDGTETLTIPSNVPNSTTARIRVESSCFSCVKFFDVGNVNFTVTSTCLAAPSNVCQSSGLTLPSGDPGLNLGLTNVGTTFSSRTFNITAASPTGPLANATTSGGTTCQTPWGTEKFDSFDFVVNQTGAYTINNTSGGQIIFSVFNATGYNPAAPCSSTFLGSNATGAISWFSSATVTLNACTTYKIVVWTLSGANGTPNFTFSGAGTLYATFQNPSASYNFTYIAVNNSNNQIAAQSSTSNFTSLAGGSYCVYGVSYINTLNPTTWIGQTVNTLLANGDCLLTSSNCKPLTITSSCPTLTTAPANVTIVNSTCNSTCTVAGGSITAPTGTPCPTGSTLQYRVNGGTWTATLPTYAQTGPVQNIETRCNCDIDNTISSPVSAAIATAPGTCTNPAQPTITITNNVCPSTTGTISGTGCGAGTVLEWATNAGGPWITTVPTYTTTALTVFARCRNTTTNCVSTSATATTAPVLCPTCPSLTTAPANVTIVNSTCNSSCTVAGGTITAPTGTPCPTGSTLQYRVNGGTWTATLPTYAQTGPVQNVETRCNCDIDNTISSPVSAAIATAPGTCTTPTQPSITITNNVCPSTTGTISATGCGAGTILEWATNAGGPWSTTVPTYTTTALTVFARCRNTTTNCVSTSATATTAPVLCPTCPTLTTAPANVTIVNSTCNSSCTVAGGTITAPTGTPCPTGSTLQYRVNGGTWTATLPTYAQTGPVQSIETRCNCDIDNTISSPVSAAIATASGTCTIPTQPTITITDNVCPSTTGTISGSGCGAGTVLEWATNAGGPWSTTAPTYTTTALTVFARCRNTTTNCVSTNATATTAPTVCPTCPSLTTAPANVTIVNSTCNSSCTVAGGTITAPTGTPCPTGSTLQYRVNGGTWTATLPTYAQTGPVQNIETRCNCDIDNTISSPVSAAIATAPGTCTTPTQPTITITDNVCPSTTGTISGSGCGAGTVLEWATNAGGPWSTTVPTYTTTALTVFARCRNTTTNCVSTSATATTAPNTCSGGASTLIQSITTCTQSGVENFNTFAGTLVTIPTGWTTSSADFNPGGYYSNTGTYSNSNSTYALGNSTDAAYGAKVATSGAEATNTMTYCMTNNTGQTINSINVTWDVEQYSIADRATTVDLTYNVNGGTFGQVGISGTSLTTADIQNPASLADANLANVIITLRNVTFATSVPATQQFCLRMTIANGGGTGGNAHIGFDNFTVTTACAAAPVCPSLANVTPNNVTITNSICTNCAVTGGLITAAVNNCPTGSTLQYRVNGGAWSTTLPVYAQTGPAQSIETRCNCDVDNTISSPVSAAIATAPGTCTTPTQPSITITNNVCPSTTGTISATGCGAGTILEWATNAGGPWSTTVPTYTTTALTVFARCRNTTTNCVSTSASATTAPTVCPTCPTLTTAPANVTIVNSTCNSSCTVAGGTITAPTGTPCPTGSTLQYRVNGGTWTATLPTYAQTGPVQSIETRCNCDIDNTISSPVSAAITTAPGTCTTPTQPTITITDNVCPSTTGTISATGCGSGTVLEWATNAGGPWSTTAPTYTTTALTVFARCRNTTTNCVSTNATATTAPTVCPTCPSLTTAPANVTIVNSTCNSSCTVAGGTITAPTGTPCPTGSTLQYRVNGGTWTATLPTYAQTGPVQNIETRCNCDIDNTISSPVSAAIATAPGTCTTPTQPTITITDNVCPSTTGTISGSGCGAGTVLEWATNAGGPWSTTAPTYTTTALTVYARCRNTTTNCVSTSATATTAPNTCSGGASTLIQSITTCTQSGVENFNTFAGTLVTIPTGWTTSSADFNPGGYYSNTGTYSNSNSTYALGNSTDAAYGAKVATSGAEATNTMTYCMTNNTGQTINSINVTWDVEQYSIADRATTVDLTYNVNGGTFGQVGISGTSLTTADIQNPASLADANLANVIITPRNVTFATSVPATQQFCLRMTIANGGGTGGNAHIGFDNFTVTTACAAAPVCPSLANVTPNNVTITNSICTNCAVTGGLITAAVNNCPTGSTLQYRVNGGAWSTTLPVYAQTGPAQSIETRCNCDVDNSISSPVSTAVTTVPGTCSIPTQPTITIVNNVCPSTTGTISATGCGAGTVLEWATNAAGPWSTTAPTYTTTALTVFARCINTSTNCVSPSATATTAPVTCSSCPTISNITTTQTCTSTSLYNVQVCFNINTPGSAGLYTITLGSVTYGPFSYSATSTSTPGQYCVTINNLTADNQTNISVIINDLGNTVAAPVIDGSTTVETAWGSARAMSDDQAGWAGVNVNDLYVTSDAQYVYFGATINAAADWQSWGFAINTLDGAGGTSEVWTFPITYGHSQLPDFVIKGHFGRGGAPYAEMRQWNGSTWVQINNSGSASGLATADFRSEETGMVEVRILKSILGNPADVDVQFYVSGNVQNEHGTFDAVPDDQVANSWNVSGNNTILDNYAPNTIIYYPPVCNATSTYNETPCLPCPTLAPLASNVYYCVGDVANALTATPQTGGVLVWYDNNPTNPNVNPLPSAPAPATSVAGNTNYWVTESVGGCEGPAAQITSFVSQVSNIDVTQTCINPITYDLQVCFEALNVGSVGMFSVFVGTTKYGPFAYSAHGGGNPNEYCVTINNAGNTNVIQTLTITVTDEGSVVNNTPIMNGVFDGISVWGAPISVADNVPGWAGANAQELYMTQDDNFIYVGAKVSAADWQTWAFLLNTKPGGGTTDSWSRAIDYTHTNRPDYVFRGTFGGYAELHTWTGAAWTGYTGLATAEFGENETTWVEGRISKSAISNPTAIDIQFYITGNNNEHGSFDAVPNDDNATSWNSNSNRTPLNNYAPTQSLEVSNFNECSATTNFTEVSCGGFTLKDPCTCNNNATVAGIDGTFNEQITVTGPAGQTITATCVGCTPTNLTFTEGPAGTYNSNVFTHVDNVGYTATISANGTVVGTINNKCAYPNVAINNIGPFTDCQGQSNVALTAVITGDNGTGGFAWSGAGVTGSNFNPSNLNPGISVVTLNYDGVNNGNVSPDGGITPAYPGCIQIDTIQVVITAAVAPPVVSNITVCAGGNTNIVPTPIPGPSASNTFTWNFEGNITGPGVSQNSTNVASNAPVQTAGSGLTGVAFQVAGSGCTGAITSAGYDITNASLADAVSDNEYYEFCIGTPNVGVVFNNVSAMNWNHRISGTGPMSYAVVASNNLTTPILTGSITGTSCAPAGGTFGSPLTAGCYRVYYWGATNSGGTLRIDNMVLTANYTLPAGNFNFYLVNPDLNPGATPIATGVSYNPGTTPATSPQTIWVTVVDPLTGCESAPVPVIVTVNPNPTLNIQQPAPACIPATVNVLNVNLGALPAGGTTGYFSNLSDAQNNVNPITTGLNAVTSTTTIFVRYQLSTGCFVVGQINVVVNPLPPAPSVPAVLTVCSGGSTLITVNTNPLSVNTTWDFESGISNPGQSSNLVVAGNGPVQTNGIGLTGVIAQAASSGCSNAITSSGYELANATLADAIADEEYFSFCVGNTMAGFTFNGVTAVNWTHRISGTGPMTWALVSANSPNTVLLTGTITGTNCVAAGGSFTINPSTCYRIYYWGATNNGGTMRIDNFSITAQYQNLAVYNWFNVNPDTNPTATPVATGNSYDPMTTATNSPQTIWVNCNNGCVSPSAQVIVNAGITPTVNSVTNQQLCPGASTTAVTFSGTPTGVVFNWTNNNTTIGLAASGTGNIPAFVAANNTIVNQVATITVTPTFTSGSVTCSGSPIQFTITVFPTPRPVITFTDNSGIASNDGIICQGATATLTASGGGTYLWSTGATTASITTGTAGTYSVTVTTNGCAGTTTAVVVVNPLPTPSITVTENSGTVPNDGTIYTGSSATLTASGGGTYLWNTGATSAAITVTPPVGMNTYTVTVTNAFGCTATASRVITVVDPPCFLICSGNQNITLTDGACQYQLPNLVTGAGVCDFFIIQQVSGPAPGTFLPRGTYEIRYRLVSNLGEFIDDCVFTVIVSANPVIVNSLACNNHVNISADLNCQVTLSPDMFLEGNSYSCYADYQINIWPFNSQANAINNVPQGVGLNLPLGNHTYEIVGPSGNKCWGTFTVEDKIAPVVTCNCSDVNTITPVTSFTGSLTTSSATMNRVLTFAAPTCTLSAVGTNVYYGRHDFSVTTTGSYTFTRTATPNSGTMHLYENSFNAASPCTNLLQIAAGTTLTRTLTAGVNYILVFTAANNGTTGTYSIGITGAGQAQVVTNPSLAPECQFRCYDLEVVSKETVPMVLRAPGANRSVLTTAPTFSDACGSATPSFEDRITKSNCGASKLIRDWKFVDASGNTSFCSQTFTFNQLTVNDLLPPVRNVDLTCGLDASPEAIAAYYDRDTRQPNSGDTNIGAYNDDWAQTTGVVELNEGYRFGYFTYQLPGFNMVPATAPNLHDQKVDNGVCNIYVSYVDQMITACGVGCGGNMKVIRTWTILDWCTGAVLPYIQVIKATDEKAPTFDVKDHTVSVDPWGCAANWTVDKPWELQDNCAKAEELKWGVKVPAGVTISGTQPNYTLSGMPKGRHAITYWAEDCCGNISENVSFVTVIDASAPVAVAKQNIVMSLTGSGTGGDGAGKIYGWQIDNGSYDHCTPVKFEVRRTGGKSCGNVGANNHNNNSTFNHSPTDDVPNNRWAHPEDTKDNNVIIDTDGGEFVKFCCEDIPTGDAFGLHEVELRVWDDGNMNGVYGDNAIIDGMRDNYNTTWVTVRVENKLPPTLVCPANVTVTCDMELNLSIGKDTKVVPANLTMTGAPKAYDLCDNLDITYTDQWVGDYNDVCKNGTLRRTFKVTKGGVVVTCVQFITVTAITAPFTVTFFNDETSEWNKCNFELSDARDAGNPEIKKPIVNYGQCDIVGENIKIDTFLFEDGACKKWRVQYTYKNWCTGEEIFTLDRLPNGNQNPNGRPIVHWYAYKDEIAPVLVCNNQMFGANPNPQNPNGGCEAQVVLEASASDAIVCADSSWVKWQMYFDGWANGTVDRLASSFVNKTWNGVWVAQARLLANGSPNPVWAQLQAQHPGLPFADLVYVTYIKPTNALGRTVKIPAGTGPTAFILDAENISHKVLWKVTDGCGNVDQCESTVMVVDKKAPTPYCVSISTALMQSTPKMVELWAKDFDKGAFDNCTPQSKLYFTFEGVAPIYSRINEAHFYKKGAVGKPSENATAKEYAEGKAYRWLPSMRSAGFVWLAAGDYNVNVSVWDEAWETDFCMVVIKVVNNGPDGSRISGQVATEDNRGVMNTEIIASAALPEYPKSEMTDLSGNYGMDIYVDTELRASKDGDDINGVTTLDLVMIQRHILGLQSLGSPYKIIAADANNDGRVTASDLTEIRKLILGVNNEYTNNTSWRFPIKGVYMDPTNPFPYTEKVMAEINNPSKYDFVAVKIGDVNGNVATNVNNDVVEARSNNTVAMTVAEAAVVAGEVLEIPVTASNFADVAGFQYTMNLKGASFVGINSGSIEMNANNVGVLANGNVTMSYATSEAVSANEGDVLFTLVVRANQATTVSEMITLNSAVTKSESYNSDLKVGSVSLRVRTAAVASIELFQNEPNPFRGQTTVSFEMPEAGAATLSVYDMTGKVVVVRNIAATKGLNSEVFTKEQLGVSGVMYYTLESGDFTATKKMIIVE